MDKILTINRAIPNNFQFEVMIEGLCDTDVAARFVITNGSTEYLYQCTKLEGNKFQVDFPPLPKEFVNDDYPCRIEVIADGHFFIPVTGLAVVTEGKPEAKVTDVKPVIKADKKEEEKPGEKEEEKAEEKKEEKEENKSEEKEEKKEETKDKVVKEAVKTVKTKKKNNRDKATRSILEHLKAKEAKEKAKYKRQLAEAEMKKRKALEREILEKAKKDREIQKLLESVKIKPNVSVKFK